MDRRNHAPVWLHDSWSRSSAHWHLRACPRRGSATGPRLGQHRTRVPSPLRGEGKRDRCQTLSVERVRGEVCPPALYWPQRAATRPSSAAHVHPSPNSRSCWSAICSALSPEGRGNDIRWSRRIDRRSQSLDRCSYTKGLGRKRGSATGLRLGQHRTRVPSPLRGEGRTDRRPARSTVG